jgi:hypothetical protein
VIRNSTIFLLACAPLFGQQYTMSTIAGDGVAGAFLTNPMSVAAGEGNNRIRVLTPVAGQNPIEFRQRPRR